MSFASVLCLSAIAAAGDIEFSGVGQTVVTSLDGVETLDTRLGLVHTANPKVLSMVLLLKPMTTLATQLFGKHTLVLTSVGLMSPLVASSETLVLNSQCPNTPTGLV